ncbi:MAG: MFS transporter [Ornithinibacter sp.]
MPTDTSPRSQPSRLRAAAGAFVTTWRNPELRRAQAAFFAAWAAEWAVTVVLAVYAYGRGGATEVGVVALIRVLPAAVVAPLATQYADRFPREKVLVAVSVVRSVSIALAGWAVFVDGPAVTVYALVTLSSAAAVLFRPVHSALLPSLCDTPPELAGANVVRGFLDSAATLAGPAASAVLLATGGPAQVLAAAALASAWAGVLMARVHPEPTPLDPVAPDSESALSRTLGGVRAVHSHSDLRLMFALVGAQTVMRGAMTVLAVVVSVELVGLGTPGVGVLNACLGAGAVIASAAAALLVGTRRLAAWFGLGVALWGAPLMVVGLFPSAASAMTMLAVVGAGNALVDVGAFTLIARIAPANVLARVFGLLESVGALAVGLGAIITPLITRALDLRSALVVLGLLTPAAVALAWRRLRSLDSLIVGRDDELALLRGVPLLDALPLPALETVARQLEHVVVPAGETVFRQGDPGDRFYVVVAGTAQVVGDGQPITDLGPGSSFGEIALLRRVPRTATVRAVDDLRLESLRGERFLALMTGSPRGREATSAHVDEMLHRFAPRPGTEPPVAT